MLSADLHPRMTALMTRASKVLFVLALLACSSGTISTDARAEPNIAITPTRTTPGGIVLLQIRDFRPGGYEASIRFDGVEIHTWAIPIGGDGDTFIQIPPIATTGGHDILVCAACDQEDLEQTATTRVIVTAGWLGPDDFNVQIQAMELTQGVRGPISIRTVPLGDPILPPDPGNHVANRRTVLRVYPWVVVGEDAPAQKWVVADLYVRRGAAIDGPYTASCYARADLAVEEMRSDPRFSLNFELPDDLVDLVPGEASLDLDFSCTIRDVLGETNTTDNLAELFDVTFEHVGMNNNFAFRFRPFLVQHTFTDGGGAEVQKFADISDLILALKSFQEILPIADGIRGVRLYPWRYIEWEGPFKDEDGVNVFDEEMIRTYLPTGRLDGNPQNDYYGFLLKQRGSRCAGHAFLDTPYFITDVCGRPLYVETHELTHAIWQSHAGNGHNEANGGGYDPSYPGSHGQVEFNTWGYDVYNRMVYPPETSRIPENKRHDYMSYGPDAWTSQYTWDGVAADLGTPAINPRAAMRVDSMTEALMQRRAQSQYRLFTGSVDFGAQQLKLSPVFAAPLSQPQLPPASDFLFSFYDANSNLLLEHWTSVILPMDDEGSRGMIVDAIQVPADWSTMVVGDGKLPWETLQRSANEPVIQNFNLSDGFQWSSQNLEQLTWSGADADGDPVSYRVLGVREGTEFNVLASDLTDSMITIDPATLPGGGNYEIFVEITDGFDSDFTPVATGWVEPLPPQPIIMHPAEGQQVLASVPLRAIALYADFQGDEPQVPMQWSLDNVPVGQGTKITLDQLGLGQHTLEVTAINDFQQQGSMSVVFSVIASVMAPSLVSPPDASVGEPRPPMLDWDPAAGATGYQLQIALDPGFTQILVDDPAVVGTEFEFLAAFPAVTYYWRVLARAQGETSDWSVEWSFGTDGFPVSNDPAPRRVALNLRVFPNPFNPSTALSFSMVHGGPVELIVYDLAGRRVRTLLRETRSSGEHTVRWDGRDDSGRSVASGVYVARVQALGLKDARRLVLVK